MTVEKYLITQWLEEGMLTSDNDCIYFHMRWKSLIDENSSQFSNNGSELQVFFQICYRHLIYDRHKRLTDTKKYYSIPFFGLMSLYRHCCQKHYRNWNALCRWFSKLRKRNKFFYCLKFSIVSTFVWQNIQLKSFNVKNHQNFLVHSIRRDTFLL